MEPPRSEQPELDTLPTQPPDHLTPWPPDYPTNAMLTIAPSPPLCGTLSLPGDKSMSHRAALFAALAEGESHIENFLVAGVTRGMLEALSALGVAWQLAGTTLTVRGCGLSNLQAPTLRPGSGQVSPLNCGNSATTLRLLAGAIAAAGIPAVLDGSPGLRRRPMARIVKPLQQMGVSVTATDGKYAPLTFHGRSNHLRSPVASYQLPVTFSLPVASAQVKTCLLLAALTADGPVTIIEPGPSRDHTERMLAEMGVLIKREQGAGSREQKGAHTAHRTPHFSTTLTPPSAPLTPLTLTLPGDFSSAAFLIVAALITPGSEITLTGVGLNPTRTGLLDALQQMGAQISITNYQLQDYEPRGDLTIRHSSLRGTEISGTLVVRMIDEFPIFAVAAAYANGETIVRDADELRHKESDRITALCGELRAVGVEVEELRDGFRLPGNTPPRGGVVDPRGDHRLAMSLAVSALGARALLSIQHPDIIHESFPEFVPALEFLGAHLD